MKKRAMYSLIGIVILVAMLTIIVVTKNPLKHDPQKIVIRNGTTGEETILEVENKDRIMERLFDVNSKISRFQIWTSGYEYMIIFYDDCELQEITVYTSNKFVSGIIAYKTNSDIIKIIEEFVK